MTKRAQQAPSDMSDERSPSYLRGSSEPKLGTAKQHYPRFRSKSTPTEECSELNHHVEQALDRPDRPNPAPAAKPDLNDERLSVLGELRSASSLKNKGGEPAPAAAAAMLALGRLRRTRRVRHERKFACLLDPRRHWFVGFWDLLTALALLFTATITPYEVAFVAPAVTGGEPIFIINRIIDFVFIVDFVMQFFLIYQADATPSRQSR